MNLSESTISQLQSLKDAGDMASAESCFNILADNEEFMIINWRI